MRFFLQIVLFFSAHILLHLDGTAQSIHYSVSFPNILHHEAQIQVTVNGSQQDKLVFRMSRSSPGRYATHEFGKNIYDIKAADENDRPVTVTRTDGDVYEVAGRHKQVKFTYTLYANHADGTYASIDDNGILLNIPASFIWVKGLEQQPISVQFALPEGKNWTIATQLKASKEPYSFTAPNLQYFMDSPIKIGSLIIKEWHLETPGTQKPIFRLALDAKASDQEAAAFSEKIKRMIQEQVAIFEELPDFDNGSYTFLTTIHPYTKGDGMEHRNSTVINLPMNFNPNSLSSTFSHEFFHCWNVERIRPQTLEPFNFEKSNMSEGLWFAEGFTQYYGELVMARAGLGNIGRFLQSLTGFINTKEVRPGSKKYSPVEMSRHAVFVDAGVAIDKSNYDNIYSSYYPYGASIALALDLELRDKFQLTLDGYMAALWKKFGKTEIPYTTEDLKDILAAYANNKAFATVFFDNYVTGHQSFDYAPLLAKAGYLLEKERPGEAWIGAIQFTNDSLPIIANNTVIGSPIYNAGLDMGDQLISIDNLPITNRTGLTAILAQYKPGQKLPLVYRHQGIEKSTVITLSESPNYRISSYDEKGIKISPEILSFRTHWLGTKVNAGQ